MLTPARYSFCIAVSVDLFRKMVWTSMTVMQEGRILPLKYEGRCYNILPETRYDRNTSRPVVGQLKTRKL